MRLGPSQLPLVLTLLALGVPCPAAVADAPQVRTAGAGSFLEIPPKSIVTSSKDGKLVLLLDFFAHSKQLQSKPAQESRAAIVGTAKHYAEMYGNKKENAAVGEVLVMVVYVKNMDEYNRPNFSGMTRHGTLTFKRGKDNTFDLAEDKLSLKLAG